MRTRFLLLSLALIGACGRAERSATDTSGGGATVQVPVADTGPAREADQEFLRKMIDHHEGLVQIATAAMTRASKPATQGDAHALHTKQAAERDSMQITLRTMYGENREARVMERSRIQHDSLQRMSGTQYDRNFYRLVVQHHQEGIAMIDSLAPRFTRDEIRAMAQKMKTDQQREIAEFQRKASAG